MNLLVNIGLEFHVQLKTKFKLFSNAKNEFSPNKNENISLYDLSFPGVLPLLNKEAIILGIKASKLLNMDLENKLVFDRKHYFYSDLPKGYQITQQFHPLGKNGFITLSSGKKININRLHIEEDTCKQIHQNEETLIDFNRSDVPLIEIVTSPDLSSGEEAQEAAMLIRDMLTENMITDGKMQNGCFRVDVNVSVRDEKSEELGTKTEIKNLNTFNNIMKAVNLEIHRQKSNILSNLPIISETYRFDETTQTNVIMRTKNESIDYRYIQDPNIPPIDISKLICDLNNDDSKKIECDEIPLMIRKVLLSNPGTFEFYNRCSNKVKNKTMASTFLANEILMTLRKKNESEVENLISLDQFVILINSMFDWSLTNRNARNILGSMPLNNESFSKMILEYQNNSFTNDDLNGIIDLVLNENQNVINDYKSGKNRAFGCLMKAILEKGNGKIDASVASKILKEKLEEN